MPDSGPVAGRRVIALWTRRGALAAIGAAGLLPFPARAQPGPDFHALAPTPPMGWNSWDSFATTINEEQARANARSHGREAAAARL